MKKLMFAAAAIAAGVAVADVTSANIVGYQTITADASDGESFYPRLGMTFVPLAGDTRTLSDFKPVEGTFSPDDDNLQIIDANTLDATSLFAYCDSEKAVITAIIKGGNPEDYIGWYDLAIGDIGDQDARADNYPIKAGDGFMGYFFGGNEIQFIAAGEAPTVSTDFTTDGGEAYYQTMVNYLPKDLTLKDIVPVEGTISPDDDNLQIIDPKTLESTSLFAYCDSEKAVVTAIIRGGNPEDYIGWYDIAIGDIGDQDARADDYPVKAGEGFMGYFFSGNQITFMFPSVLD